MRRRSGRSAIIASIAVFVAACSAASSGSTQPDTTEARPDFTEPMAWQEGDPTPDGCIVMTAEEVSAASGFTIVQSTPMLNSEPGCGYFDADGLVFSTRFHQRASTGQGHWDAELARGDFERVPAIGDDAIWLERGWNLWSMQGKTLVMMGIGRIGETPARFNLAKKLGPLLVKRFN